MKIQVSIVLTNTLVPIMRTCRQFLKPLAVRWAWPLSQDAHIHDRLTALCIAHAFSFLQTNCSQMKSLHCIGLQCNGRVQHIHIKNAIVFLCNKKKRERQTVRNFRQRQKPAASQQAVEENEPHCGAHLPLSESCLCSALLHLCSAFLL